MSSVDGLVQRAAVRQTPIPHGASVPRLRNDAHHLSSIRDAPMRNSASLVAVLALIVGVHTSARAQRMDSKMIGAWAGRAQIAVPWSQQRELAVRVLIRDDGSVSGMIGDAQLIDGRFASARGPAGRALRIGREFAIGGGLSGPVIRSEAVQRASVRLSLDWKGQTFEGELQTSGTPQGSSADMALSATGLVLRRAGTAVSLRASQRAIIAAPRVRAYSECLRHALAPRRTWKVIAVAGRCPIAREFRWRRRRQTT